MARSVFKTRFSIWCGACGVNGDNVCLRCREDEYFCCDSCGEIISNDYYSDDGICTTCAENNRENDSYWRKYKNDSTLLIFEKGTILSSPRPFGIELETFANDEDDISDLDIDDRIGLEHDGSINASYGVEFQTPPACGKKAENMIISLCDSLSSADFNVNSSCGYHIHIDTSDITDNRSAIIGLFAFYIVFEDVIMSFLPKGRRENGFCKGLRSDYHMKEIYKADSIDQIEKIWYRVRTEVDVKRCKDDKKHDSRYRGVNMHTLFSQNNLEVRFHSGTINHQKILNWAILHQNIIDRADTLYYEQTLLQKAVNIIDMVEKTKLFFDLLNIPNEIRDYFISRQKIFSSTERTNVSLDTFKMTERIISNENEL